MCSVRGDEDVVVDEQECLCLHLRAKEMDIVLHAYQGHCTWLRSRTKGVARCLWSST